MPSLFELPHDKPNKMACAPSEDSDQPGHPSSLIRVFAVRMKKAWVLSYLLSAHNAQADLSLRWAHSHFVGFDMRRPIYWTSLFIISVGSGVLLIFSSSYFFIDIPVCKQCTPWSDAAFPKNRTLGMKVLGTRLGIIGWLETYMAQNLHHFPPLSICYLLYGIGNSL